jgi:pectinesterase
VFLDCEMGDHIIAEGWHDWDRAANEATAFYAEYHSVGPGSNPARRVPWSKQLSGDSAEKYSMENIFRGWKPDY